MMRINRYLAQYVGTSRRKADEMISAGRVVVNRKVANLGTQVDELSDIVLVDGEKIVAVKRVARTVLLHKPVGYVCSKDGQGAPTVYDLLQRSMQSLNIAGRLDKDSSGLVILTDDGDLLQELTHPSNDKEKIYEVTLNKPLEDGLIAKLASGVDIHDDRLSKLMVVPIEGKERYQVSIQEGRNRQIRRSFEVLGYQVIRLHRTQLGQFELGPLAPKQFKAI
jgi:pseudouridine synthase